MNCIMDVVQEGDMCRLVMEEEEASERLSWEGLEGRSALEGEGEEGDQVRRQQHHLSCD